MYVFRRYEFCTVCMHVCMYGQYECIIKWMEVCYHMGSSSIWGVCMYVCTMHAKLCLWEWSLAMLSVCISRFIFHPNKCVHEYELNLNISSLVAHMYIQISLGIPRTLTKLYFRNLRLSPKESDLSEQADRILLSIRSLHMGDGQKKKLLMETPPTASKPWVSWNHLVS